MEENNRTYFLTVSWCNDGRRGIFCSDEGNGFSKEGEPHTEHEMWEILGPFALILNPQSLPFTEAEIGEYIIFRPLPEYTKKYGIALKEREK